MITNSKQYILISFSLILFAIASRLIFHPANVTAIGAIALVSGMLLPKKYAATTILSGVVISDLFIGLHSLVFFTWGSFLLITLIASRWSKGLSFNKLFFGSLFSSTLFFFVTNFGVWLEGRLYTLDFHGLIQSYVNALPFYRNMLLGDLLYSGILLFAYIMVMNISRLLSYERIARV